MMSTNLDEVITKLSDKGVQDRLRSAVRKATTHALKQEGIELSPAELGELTARIIAAKPDPIRPNFDWGSLIPVALPIILGALSDRRLKTNVVHCWTRADGLGIYEYSYAGFTNRWRGVIAQQVLQSHPDAVVEDEDGYLRVNYNALELSLQPVLAHPAVTSAKG
jgi:hypothetical protein